MTESKGKGSELETFEKLDEALAEDVLGEAYTKDQVAAMLRAEGGDPAAIGERGLETVVSSLSSASREPVAKQKSRRFRNRPARRALLDVVYARKDKIKKRRDKKKPEDLSDTELLDLARAVMNDGSDDDVKDS